MKNNQNNQNNQPNGFNEILLKMQAELRPKGNHIWIQNSKEDVVKLGGVVSVVEQALPLEEVQGINGLQIASDRRKADATLITWFAMAQAYTGQARLIASLNQKHYCNNEMFSKGFMGRKLLKSTSEKFNVTEYKGKRGRFSTIMELPKGSEFAEVIGLVSDTFFQDNEEFKPDLLSISNKEFKALPAGTKVSFDDSCDLVNQIKEEAAQARLESLEDTKEGRPARMNEQAVFNLVQGAASNGMVIVSEDTAASWRFFNAYGMDSSEERSKYTLKGIEDKVDVDFTSAHPNFIAALENRSVETYELAAAMFGKKKAKVVFLAMFNSESAHSLSFDKKLQANVGSSEDIKAIIKVIEEENKVSSFWKGREFFLKASKIESLIQLEVRPQARQKGIRVVFVHDGATCDRKHSEWLKNAMQKAASKVIMTMQMEMGRCPSDSVTIPVTIKSI